MSAFKVSVRKLLDEALKLNEENAKESKEEYKTFKQRQRKETMERYVNAIKKNRRITGLNLVRHANPPIKQRDSLSYGNTNQKNQRQ